MKKKRILIYIAFFILVGIVLSLTIIKKSYVLKVKVHLMRKGNIVRYINTTGIFQKKVNRNIIFIGSWNIFRNLSG